MSRNEKSQRPHFAGLRRGYCKQSECPVRHVFYSVKRDPAPDAPAICPRCRGPLTLFHWTEEAGERSWPELEREGNILRRQQG